MLTGALIGLGVLSAGHAIYSGYKNRQVANRANDINENAAQLSYQSAKETNDLNYQIFKEQQEYNSPAHLKEMYDALGLNGSAIVANQGFTPTAAPQMLAPEMNQVDFMQTQTENPADKMMTALMTALTSSKMRVEIDKIAKEAIQVEAQTDNCKQSTNLLLKHIYGAELANKLTENEVNLINEKNAEFRVSFDKLQQEVAYNKEMMPRLLRQFDDKNLLDGIERQLKENELEYNKKTLRNRVAAIGVALRNAIKNGEHLDITNEIAELTRDITESQRDYERNTEYKKTMAANARYHEETQESKIHSASLELNDPSTAQGELTAIVSSLLEGIMSPLKGIIKIKN